MHAAVTVMPQVVIPHRVERGRDRVAAEHFHSPDSRGLPPERHVGRIVEHDAERVKAAGHDKSHDRIAPPGRRGHHDPRSRDHRPLLERHAQEPGLVRRLEQLARHVSPRDVRDGGRVERLFEIVREVRRFAGAVSSGLQRTSHPVCRITREGLEARRSEVIGSFLLRERESFGPRDSVGWSLVKMSST